MAAGEKNVTTNTVHMTGPVDSLQGTYWCLLLYIILTCSHSCCKATSRLVIGTVESTLLSLQTLDDGFLNNNVTLLQS